MPNCRNSTVQARIGSVQIEAQIGPNCHTVTAAAGGTPPSPHRLPAQRPSGHGRHGRAALPPQPSPHLSHGAPPRSASSAHRPRRDGRRHCRREGSSSGLSEEDRWRVRVRRVAAPPEPLGRERLGRGGLCRSSSLERLPWLVTMAHANTV